MLFSQTYKLFSNNLILCCTADLGALRKASPVLFVETTGEDSSSTYKEKNECLIWTDARRPVPRLWIRSAEVGGGGTSLGE